MALARKSGGGTRNPSFRAISAPIDEDERLNLSANHWQRAWFRRAHAHPDVEVERGGDSATG